MVYFFENFLLFVILCCAIRDVWLSPGMCHVSLSEGEGMVWYVPLMLVMRCISRTDDNAVADAFTRLSGHLPGTSSSLRL